MSNTHIFPTELHLLLLIEFLVTSSRKNVFSGQKDAYLPFELLCFFQDSIDLPKSPQFKSRVQMVCSVAPYIQSDLSVGCKAKLEGALLGQKIDSVDSLVDFFDSLMVCACTEQQAARHVVTVCVHASNVFVTLFLRH